MTSLKTAHSPTARKAVVALVAAGLGLAALTPSAFAAGPNFGNGNDRQDRQAFRMDGDNQGQGMRQGWGRQHDRNMGMNMRMGPQGGRGMMMIGLGCGPNAAERIEHALVSLSYRIDPTDEQTKLLDDLKTTALDAQQQYASVCDAVMPQRQAKRDASQPKSNILEMMQSRLQVDQARVTALGDILPKFEALYNSLSDEQKASLEPRYMHRNGRGFGPNQGPAAPAPNAPEAPLEPQNG